MSRNPDKDNAISDKAVCESICSQAGLLLMVLYATIGASGSVEVVLKVLVIMHYELIIMN